MKRTLFYLLAITSTAISGTLAALWIRSYTIADGCDFSTATRYRAIWSASGHVTMRSEHSEPYAVAQDFSPYSPTQEMPLVDPPHSFFRKPPKQMAMTIPTPALIRNWHLLGFRWHITRDWHSPPPLVSGSWYVIEQGWSVQVPFAAILLPFGIASVMLVRKILRSRTFQAGHCPACGYDLRASPARCPECGKIKLN